VIWLLPAALCSISIAAILKVNEHRGGDRLVLAGANYLVAAGLSLLLLRGASGGISGRTLALGAVTGADYVLGFLILMAGIARGPLAVPVTVMRLSVAVPVVVSIFVWSESPRTPQWAGLAAGLLAIVLFGLGIGRGSGNRTRAGFLPLMAAMFAVMGLGDVLLKAFRETAPDSERLLFTLILFGSAGLLTWLMILACGRRLRRGTVLLGLLLGVPNLFSTVFTLLALRTVPASIAFPFINLTVIFGSTLLGRTVWKERLGGLAAAGLAAAAIALVLLRL
jgi:drug/metabolite transporter (DMT)-like permease